MIDHLESLMIDPPLETLMIHPPPPHLPLGHTPTHPRGVRQRGGGFAEEALEMGQ